MEIQQQSQRCRRLVLVPCPFQGHITPMLQLGTILHSKGFYITIAHTQFNFPNPLNYPDFNFLAMPDGLNEQNVSSNNFIAVILGFNANCKSPLRESLAWMMQKEEQDDKIASIIYDEYMYFSEEVANHLGLPSIILSTSSAANMLTYHSIPRLLKDGYIPFEDSMMMELVPELQPLRFKDLPITNFRDLDDLLQLIAKAHNSRSSSAIIWNTMDCLGQSLLARLQQEYHLPLFPMGPLHKTVPATSISLLKEDQNCISWLNKQANNSVIYASLGSIAFTESKDLVEMARGIANSEQPFLWVVPTDSILPEGFQETVGERGCAVKWAPQKQVLAHSAVGGFWSHCGWNSTIECVRRSSNDMPTIFWRPESERKVLKPSMGSRARWENDMNRGVIEGAIRMLMVGKEGEVISQRAKDLKEKIELCMKQGGSSYNSLNELVDHILSY